MADKDTGSAEDFPSERLGKIPTRPRLGTALVETSLGAMQAMQYVEVDGMAVVEGDIVLGTVEDVEAATSMMRDAGPGRDGGGDHRCPVPLAELHRSPTRSTRTCPTRRGSPTRSSTGVTTPG